MKKLGLVFLAAAVLGGCCSNPGVFGKLEQSLLTVQGFYDPLVSELLDDPTNMKVRLAVIAADSALLACGTLQEQWCPDLVDVKQVAIQTEVAASQAATVLPAEKFIP